MDRTGTRLDRSGQGSASLSGPYELGHQHAGDGVRGAGPGLAGRAGTMGTGIPAHGSVEDHAVPESVRGAGRIAAAGAESGAAVAAAEQWRFIVIAKAVRTRDRQAAEPQTGAGIGERGRGVRGMKHIQTYLCERPWCITERTMDTIMSVVYRESDIEAVAAKHGRPLDNTGNRVEQRGSVAVLDV